MPWIDEDDCVACGICVDECPTEAIVLVTDSAEIDMEKCIRCGICHDVCPQDAVKHDSLKVGERVQENIEWTKGLMSHYDTSEERKGFIDRMKKHFNNERRIAEETMEKLESIEI